MGFFSKLLNATIKVLESAQPESSKSKSAEPTWEVERYDTQTGFPQTFLRNGREWLDAYKTWASPSGSFFVHDGYIYSGGDEGKTCIALPTRTEGLKRKAIEDGVEMACVSDDGVAYALTDTGTLHRLTKDSTSLRHLMEDYDEFVMNDKVCVLIGDDGSIVSLAVVNLTTNASIKKQFPYEEDLELEDGSYLSMSFSVEDDKITITIPDGTKQVVNIP